MVAVVHQSVVYDTRVTFGFRSVLGTRTISVEESFVSGVSITHGPPGTTQHVWTFVGALRKQTISTMGYITILVLLSVTRAYEISSFIGNDYFYDTGNCGLENMVVKLPPQYPMLWC